MGHAAFDLLKHVRGLLMRCLRTRGHKASPAAIGIRAGASGAVTQRKNIGVARGLQRIEDDQLVDAVGFKTAEVFQKIRCFHACGPHYQFRFDLASIGQANAGGRDFHHLGTGEYLDTQMGEEFLCGLRHAWLQSRQYSVGRLDQADFDVLVHVNAVQAKRHHLARGAVQLCGQLDARGTRADDGHMQLTFVDDF